MDHDAFISGFLAERRLQKQAVGNYSAPKAPARPALPPADNPGGASNPPGSSSIPPIGTPNNTGGSPAKQELQTQQSIARQEGDIIDRHGPTGILHPVNTARNVISQLKSDSSYRGNVDEQLGGIKPGQSIVPEALGMNKLLGQDEIMQRPAVLDYAKQQAVTKSQEIAKATPLNELSQMNAGQMGGNHVATNAIKQHVGNDPSNLAALTKIIGNKPGVYGMAGVGPGLKAKFTPQNFQFGQFANDHWGKILAGLAALLMGGHLAGKLGQSQQQRRPEVWD
jgi:hypothetical protein